MPSLNLDLDYFEHPKTQRLVGLLRAHAGRGCGQDAALLPIRLWVHCGKFHAESGELHGYEPGEIESIMKWDGAAGEAVKAMLKVGLLEEIEGGYRVHDWLQHCGHLQAFKLRARKAAAVRWGTCAAEDAGTSHPTQERSLGSPTSNPLSNASNDPSSNANGNGKHHNSNARDIPSIATSSPRMTAEQSAKQCPNDDVLNRLAQLNERRRRSATGGEANSGQAPMPAEPPGDVVVGSKKREEAGTSSASRSGSSPAATAMTPTARFSELLEQAGIEVTDPILRNPNCTEKRLAIALENMRAERKSVQSKSGYVCDCIRRAKLTLSPRALDRRRSPEAAEMEQQRLADAAQQKAEIEIENSVASTIAAMSDQTLAEYAKLAMDEEIEPLRKLMEKKDPRTNPFLRHRIHQRWLRDHPPQTASPAEDPL
jgi:hypothetical protein